MSTDLRAIIDRDARHRRMLTDPDLTGDLLLFALALDEVIDARAERKPGGRVLRAGWVSEVTVLAKGDAPAYQHWGRLVLSGDLPRYQAEQTRGRRCVAPMIRRDGECGQRGSISLMDYDPATGAARLVDFCARHKDQAGPVQARQREWAANGRPRPPANNGGILRRWYSGNWNGIYRWASGREPMDGGREATPPRPTLRLIQGGAELREVGDE